MLSLSQPLAFRPSMLLMQLDVGKTWTILDVVTFPHTVSRA